MADIDIDWSRTGLDHIQALVSGFTGDVIEEITDDMRRMVPVDTGALLESIDSIHEGLHGLITVGTDYWEFVEYGTSRMAAQPFIRPAIYRERG